MEPPTVSRFLYRPHYRRIKSESQDYFEPDRGPLSGSPNPAETERYNDLMTQQASELLQKALSLSEEERAELAGSLIESLDATVDEAAEAAWNQEIARRIEDLDSGKAKTVPWAEVRSRTSSKLIHGK
jgi:putative addiction module component (TIGR02574 family)